MEWHEDRIIRTVEQVLETEVLNGAKIILKDAKKNCPEDEGPLKKSGRIVKWKKGGVIGAYVKFGGEKHFVDGVDTFYAHFVELGTPGKVYKAKRLRGKKRRPVKAKPFLRPAYKRYRRQYRKRLKDTLT